MAGRYKAYSEYKDSGVEWVKSIPTHWQSAQLSKLFEIKAGGDLKIEYFSPVLSEFHPYPIYTNATDERVVYGYTSKAFFNGNSITVSGRGDVGYAIYREQPFDAIIRLLVLTPRSEIAPKFFMYFIREVIDFQVESSAIGQLSTNQISPFKVVFPNFKEQQKIANFLDHETAKIDTLIAKQEKLIELLKEKRQAVISHAVTKGLNPDVPMKDSGVEWLGDVPEHWGIKKLKYCAQLINKKYKIENKPVVALENIEGSTGKYLPSASQYTGEDVGFIKNDILFGKLRPYLAKVYLCQGTGISFGDLLTYRPRDNIYPRFLFYIMISSSFIEIVNSSTYGTKMPRASSDFINEMQISLPPIEEQILIAKKIDSILNNVEQLIIKANSAINLMQERKTALISAAVTGKIDVRDWQPKGIQ